MFTESLFVEVASAFHFAMIAGALSILIKLKWSLTWLGHLSAHEGCSILLELGTLWFNFVLIVTKETCSVFAVYTWLSVYLCSRWLSLASRDGETSLRFVFAVECCLISLENRATWLSSRVISSLITEENSLVTLESISIWWHDLVLNSGKLLSQSVACV